MKHKYFIKPPIDIYQSVGSRYYQEYKTYAEYNYLRGGFSSYIKIWHFEMALKLTQKYHHHCNVIDFGCADGVFIPSLSKYFNRVVAVDKIPDFIKISSKLVSTLGLNNVELICNDSRTINDVKSRISSEKYHILYLLETIEHVGSKDSLYKSKIDFLKEIATLVDEEGIIVISAPRMVGISFLIQRIGLALLGLNREPISMSNLLKASFLSDTTDLEKQWHGGHIGFNHKKLENHLKNEFHILKKKDIIFQVLYVIRRKTKGKKRTLPNTV